MKNWKTTLIGILTGGGISIDAIVRQGFTEGWHQALIGLAIALLGLYAKDHNVSGSVQKASDEGTEGGVGNRPDDRKPGTP